MGVPTTGAEQGIPYIPAVPQNAPLAESVPVPVPVPVPVAKPVEVPVPLPVSVPFVAVAVLAAPEVGLRLVPALDVLKLDEDDGPEPPLLGRDVPLEVAAAEPLPPLLRLELLALVGLGPASSVRPVQFPIPSRSAQPPAMTPETPMPHTRPAAPRHRAIVRAVSLRAQL